MFNSIVTDEDERIITLATSAIPRLARVLRVVLNRLDRFMVGQSRYLSDLCLMGYFLHFKENSLAVLHLGQFESTGYAYFSNTRSAFEAAEDSLYLASCGIREMQEIAAKIRVFERFEHGDIHAKFVEATSAE